MTTTPKTKIEFWAAKFAANKARDRRTCKELESLGWRVLVVWECELRDLPALQERLAQFFAVEVDVPARNT